MGLGILMAFAFLWTLLVRPDVLDQIDGYRVYGIGANVLFGAGWIIFGISLIERRQSEAASGSATAGRGA